MTDRVKFLDIETIFREDSRTLLSEAYPEIVRTYFLPEDVLNGTVKDIESALETFHPTSESLVNLQAAEVAGKARKGVLEALGKELNSATADPIPNKTKMIPECCEVIAIGYGDGHMDDISIVDTETTEADLLAAFWDQLEEDMTSGVKGPYGWRLATFDMPVLIAASCRHKVPVPAYVQAGTRFHTNGFIDMAQQRGWDGKLRDVCLATGFDQEQDDPLGTGAAVASAWDSGQLDSIAAHCAVDLLRCKHVYNLYKGSLW